MATSAPPASSRPVGSPPSRRPRKRLSRREIILGIITILALIGFLIMAIITLIGDNDHKPVVKAAPKPLACPSGTTAQPLNIGSLTYGTAKLSLDPNQPKELGGRTIWDLRGTMPWPVKGVVIHFINPSGVAWWDLQDAKGGQVFQRLDPMAYGHSASTIVSVDFCTP